MLREMVSKVILKQFPLYVQTVFQSANMPHPQYIKLSFYFWAVGEDVLYQCLFRLALWETSSSCSSSQLSTWFMEMWTISGLALQSSPDKLVPSAHVTVVCFLHWPIFIQADKLNLPCFWRSYFFFSPLFPYLTCSAITGDVGLTPRNELHKTVWHVLYFPSSYTLIWIISRL